MIKKSDIEALDLLKAAEHARGWKANAGGLPCASYYAGENGYG